MNDVVWKGILSDWTHIQGFGTEGKYACLNDQQRQTLLSFVQVAYWRTRWANAPSNDILDAFVAELENDLMTDCSILSSGATFELRQVDCRIELWVDSALVTSVTLDPEKCDLLNKGGEGTKIVAPGETAADKKTALFSGAMALLIYCSEAVTDAFNAIEAEIELGKAATVWMETVPGLDLSPAYEVLEACDDFNEMLESIFIATDTPEYREDMSCTILCWCVTNDYTFDASIIDKWREYLTNEGLTPPDYFYSNFVDVATYKALIDRFSLGMNDEDEDWLILCDSCMRVIVWIDFDDDGAYTFVKYGGYAGYKLAIVDTTFGNPLQSGKSDGWGESPTEYINAQVCIRVDFDTPQTIVQVSMDCYYVGDIQSNASQSILLYNAADELIDSLYEISSETRGKWNHFDNEVSPVAENVSYAIVSYGCDHTENEHVILHLDNVIFYGEELT